MPQRARRVETTLRAERDLLECALFIARDSLSAAERFVEDVGRRYELLARLTQAGQTAK